MSPIGMEGQESCSNLTSAQKAKIEKTQLVNKGIECIKQECYTVFEENSKLHREQDKYEEVQEQYFKEFEENQRPFVERIIERMDNDCKRLKIEYETQALLEKHK